MRMNAAPGRVADLRLVRLIPGAARPDQVPGGVKAGDSSCGNAIAHESTNNAKGVTESIAIEFKNRDGRSVRLKTEIGIAIAGRISH